MTKNHTIEVTCILSAEQLKRLQAITEAIKNDGKKDWTEQMALQLAIGNIHMTEIILTMLEGYVANNIK